jgi:hypothetical protein
MSDKLPVPPIAIEAGKRGKAAADLLSEKICTLAVTFIGFTVAFLPEELRERATNDVWLLHTSWIAFALSALFSLAYFYAPVDMAESAISYIKANPEKTNIQMIGWRGFIWCFRLSGFTFVVGTGCFVCFAVRAT